MARLGQLPPGVPSIRLAVELLANEPELKNDSEVQARIGQLEAAHFKSIVYRPVQEALVKATKAEDQVPSIIVNPLLRGVPGGNSDDDVVLAWIRGMHNGVAVPLRHFLAGPRVILTPNLSELEWFTREVAAGRSGLETRARWLVEQCFSAVVVNGGQA